MSGPPPGTGPDIPGYRWVRALGSGGFADVHLYQQESPARDVAVKVLRVAGDETGRAALAREANALATVAGHPAVVSLYASGLTGDGRPFLAMEYCPVTDLSEQVRSRPLAVARALDLMVQLCAAAETLHRSGLVHRDIKPANLMLTRWGQPVLADFGSTLPVGAGAPEGGGFSLLWAPPEQHVAGTPAHPSQDVWALAATAWTLLAGHSPFEEPGGDNSAAAVAGRVRAGRLPALGRPDAPEELTAALRAALALDPAARTRSALELAERLQAVQDRLGRPRTRALVPLDAPAAGVQVDGNRTRVRAAPTIDPDAAPPAPAGAVAVEFSADADPEATLPPGAARPPTRGSVAESATARRGVRPWVVGLVVALAVVATAAGVTAGLLGSGGLAPRTGASAPVRPLDPVVEPPDPVSRLTGKLTKGRVFWTWQPASDPGVRYIFTVTRPGRDPITKETTLTGTDVEAVTGENCIEISVTTPAGRESTPAESCVTAP